jgi:archaellum component FlaC
MLMELREVVMIWNIVITIVMAVIGFFLKEKFNEIQRLSILLNRTREEIARDSVTQAEIDKILDHIDQRFNKLEDKINQLIAK